MTISAALLNELHRILRQLTDLRSRLERGPKQIAAAEAHVQKMDAELAVAKEQMTRTRVNADQKELNLREREGRIVGIQTKLNGASSNREYQALLEQIEADQQANSCLQDEILELLDKVSEQQEGISQIAAQKVTVENDLKAVRERVNSVRASLEEDVARLAQELAAAENNLPADFRRDYDRLVKARGEDALAPVDGETCGGCYQTLTTQTINELMMSKPILCKACGCILYIAESRDLSAGA